MSVEQMFEKILNKLCNFEKRSENIETKLDNFQMRLEQVEKFFNAEIPKINEITTTKVSQDEFFLLKSEFESFVKSDRIEGLMKELYDKRLNILVHGLEETERVWETKEKSKVIFNSFLKEGLKIEPHVIHPIDVHRLPQHPVFKNQKKITRPIIVKLADSFEKHLIMKSLKNLKAYNETRCKKKNIETRVKYSCPITCPKNFKSTKNW